MGERDVVAVGAEADWLHLCSAAELIEGRSRGFDPGGNGCDTLFLLRWQGELRAWRNACPHINGAPMAWRRDAYMNATGLCVQGPCLGQSLQPLALKVAAGGEVHVQRHGM